MLIIDMHNYIKQGLHRLNSRLFRGYEPEQIDLVLNRAQSVCFEERYGWLKGDGIEMSRKNIGELSNIMVGHRSVNSFIAYDNSNFEYVINDVPAKFKVVLPDDCYYVQNIEPRIYYNLCDDISWEAIKSTWAGAVISIDTDPDIIGASAIGGIQVYLDTTLAPITITRLVGYPDWADYNFPEDGDAFIDHLVKAVNKRINDDGYTCVYEAYNGLFYPGYIIILKEGSGLPGASVKARVVYTGTSYTSEENYSLYDYYPTSSVDLSNGDYKYSVGNIRRHADRSVLLSNAFHKPRYSAMPVFVGERHADIFTDGTYVVTSATISYVRKPKQMSLSLNQNCELNASLHRKICDTAIEYLVAANSRNNFQQMVIETEKAG